MAGGSDVITTARAMIEACARRDFAAAYANASPVLVSGVPEFILAETWARAVRLAGEFRGIESVRSYRHLLAPIRLVMVACKFEKLTVEIQLGFEQSGQIVGMALLTPGLE